jgi:hypothetical protein
MNTNITIIILTTTTTTPYRRQRLLIIHVSGITGLSAAISSAAPPAL